MYVIIISLTVLGLFSQRNQVRGDFINPLHYIRYERAVTQPGECLIECLIIEWAGIKVISRMIQ